MDYLSQHEREQIQAMRLVDPFAEETLQQVGPLLATPRSAGSSSMPRISSAS